MRIIPVCAALTEEPLAGLHDGAKDRVGVRRNGDPFEGIVAETGALVESQAVPTDAVSALDHKESDPRSELRDLLNESVEHFLERFSVFQLCHGRTDLRQPARAAPTTADGQLPELLNERQDLPLVDVLLVLGHSLLDGVQLTDDAILDRGDLPTKLIGPSGKQRMKQGQRLGPKLFLVTHPLMPCARST